MTEVFLCCPSFLAGIPGAFAYSGTAQPCLAITASGKRVSRPQDGGGGGDSIL